MKKKVCTFMLSLTFVLTGCLLCMLCFLHELFPLIYKNEIYCPALKHHIAYIALIFQILKRVGVLKTDFRLLCILRLLHVQHVKQVRIITDRCLYLICNHKIVFNFNICL